MLEGGLVEDKDVAERCKGGVDESAEEPVEELVFCFGVCKSNSATYHVRMYKLIVCLQTLSLSHLLMYAYSLGWTLIYWLAGSNCHVLRKTSTAAVALSKDVELSRPLRPAVIVLMGSKAEKAEALGRRLAYMRSNMTLSKISRTKSMAVVCRVYVPDWRGCRVELSSGRRERSRSRS